MWLVKKLSTAAIILGAIIGVIIEAIKELRLTTTVESRTFARVLDLGDTLTTAKISYNPENADIKALQSDWVQVGKDIAWGIERYKDEAYARR